MSVAELDDLGSRAEQTGPGKRLREARQSLNLEIDDVCVRLHLDRATVRRLEEDKYGELPAPAFVRGYLGAYARLLELPPGPILTAFDRFGLAPPALVPDIANRPQARSSDMPVRIATYAIVGVLIGLVVAWWQSQGSARNAGEDTRASAASVGAQVESKGTPKAMDEPVSAAPEVPLTDVAASPGTSPEHAETEPDESPEGPPAAPDTLLSEIPERDQPETAPADERGPSSDIPDQSPPDPVADTGRLVTEEKQTEPTAPIRDEELILRLSKDSWIEVYDGRNEKRHFGMGRAGKTVALQAPGPFRVLLGYARGVEIEYNGAPFDHTPYIRKEMARFTLGKAPADMQGLAPTPGTDFSTPETPVR